MPRMTQKTAPMAPPGSGTTMHRQMSSKSLVMSAGDSERVGVKEPAQAPTGQRGDEDDATDGRRSEDSAPGGSASVATEPM